ncbi:response regulator transcription factor [Priestia endophytica]|uniref:response regulator transcription factor n=1 Tax=Priestia endophytica TaxID=135735 RepID=UPI000F5483A2|nr:response regulator transcription factor [Priestia endophytica]RPK12618.1 hypothetical protein FH5_02824 [Priestia endophytica]
MANTILYIEDDTEIGTFTKAFLESKGFEIIWLKSSYDHEKYLEKSDLVLLDIMIPGLDGFTVGQRIKNRNAETPLLLQTARTSIEDKLKGLNFADDYITKPFHPEELAARIDILLRRFDKVSEDCIEIHHLKVNIKEKRIINVEKDEEILLTEKQLKIFFYLLRHPNQILTKEQIYEMVWERTFIEGDKTLMVHIRHLRQKIEKDPNNPKIVETIRGIGYRIRQ